MKTNNIENLINPLNTVLFPWAGSKRKLTNKIQETIDLMTIDKVETFIDGFGGSMNFTINNISKIQANKYILNDINSTLYSTYKAVKEDNEKVIYLYEQIRYDFYSLDIDKNLKNENVIKKEFRNNNMKLREFYKNKINQLNAEEDIFKISALFIWVMQHMSNAMLKYTKDNKIDNSGFKWNYKIGSKINHIKYYSHILNKYDVIMENLDIFDLLKKYKNRDNSFIYLDPGYLKSIHSYNQSISNKFHKDLVLETSEFRYRLYSNEDTKLLYRLKIDKNFQYYRTFLRDSNLGQSNSNGREFLSYSINNTTYNPIQREVS